MSKKSNQFSPEVRERAVRMVQAHRSGYPSLWAAIESIAPKIGVCPRPSTNGASARTSGAVPGPAVMLAESTAGFSLVPKVLKSKSQLNTRQRCWCTAFYPRRHCHHPPLDYCTKPVRGESPNSAASVRSAEDIGR